MSLDFLKNKHNCQFSVWLWYSLNIVANQKRLKVNMVSIGYQHCTTSFIKAWTQVLRRFKSCSRRVGDSRWWGSLTMVPAENKANTFTPFVGQPDHKNNSWYIYIYIICIYIYIYIYTYIYIQYLYNYIYMHHMFWV